MMVVAPIFVVGAVLLASSSRDSGTLDSALSLVAFYTFWLLAAMLPVAGGVVWLRNR